MREHFSAKLVGILLIITISVMSIFVAIRYYYSNLDFEASITSNAQSISSRIAEQVSPSIWEIYQSSVSRKFSEDAAVAVLNSEMKSNHIDAIVVHGRFGHTYMGRVKDESGKVIPYSSQHESVLDQHKYQISHSIKNGSMTIGKVSVFFNDQPLRSQQTSTLKFDLIQIVIISALIVLALYIIIRQVLIKPLESLEIANSTFRSLGEGIVYIHNDNSVLDANPAFCSMTGFSREKTINEPCHFFTLNESEEAFLKEIDLAINQRNNWIGEASCKRKDGTTFPIHLTASQVYNEEQQKICRVLIFQDITSQKNTENQLKNLAFYDPLTSLYNRRMFEDLMNTEINASKRLNTTMGLLFIDLDDFKFINDTLGHSTGDQLLVEIASRFKDRVRDSDHLSRLGGDEFTVIIRHLESPENLVALAEDLISLASQPILLQDKEYKLGASIGISIYPRDGHTYEELIKHADSAMYQAKESGKGGYNFYSHMLDQKIQYKQRLKSLLRDALSKQELFLLYQPKVKLDEQHETIGAEALIRWQNEEHGFISPEEFIPIAEESNAIIEIGEWVIKEAFASAYKINLNRKSQPLKIAINLSPIQLHSQTLIPFIRQQLHQLNVEANWIEFEITESSIISDLDLSIEILKKLKEIGFSLSLDDFGTGYSSLSYLTKLPIDILKIDKSFVLDVGQSARSESVVETIIALSKSLGLETIAEGIETEEHVSFLRNLQCEYGQGYHYSRPIPLEDLQGFMQKKPSGKVVPINGSES